jgi:hypothetical protein
MTYEEYRLEGLPRLAAVFATPDPYEPVVAGGVEKAAIIYPVAPLSLGQRHAIAAAAARAGDDSLYLTMLERRDGCYRSKDGLRRTEPDLMSLTENWLLPLDDTEQYEQTNAARVGLDHALHSPNGRWAVLVCHEGHAVVGGDAAFMRAAFESFPFDEEGLTVDTSVKYWLTDMRGLADSLGGRETSAWVPKLTLTIYGAERGGALLSATGWTSVTP